MNENACDADRRPIASKRDMVHVNLLGQSTLLRSYAARQGVPLGVAIRTAVARMLQGEATDPDPGDAAAGPSATGGEKVRVLLTLNPVESALLTDRSSAAGVSRSRYVMALMTGAAPPPLPQNHDAMVTALVASTAGMAIQWMDLNVFLRLQADAAREAEAPATQAASPGLVSVVADLHAMARELRAHLVLASGLLAELDKARRLR